MKDLPVIIFERLNIMFRYSLILYTAFFCAVSGFVMPGWTKNSSSMNKFVMRATDLETMAPTEPGMVEILSDAEAVGNRVKEIVVEEGKKAIAARGKFALAIPGGSILKMLTGMNPDIMSEIAEKTTIVYVNHKCVAMDDLKLATHAKARNLFLDDDAWKAANVIVMDGTSDGDAEAKSYENKIRKQDAQALPTNEEGIPVFDLALIGVGDDGHVGSLYPGREEVLVGNDGPIVLPVCMKDPPSITLSLPVMKAAQKVIVAACGVSEKYPQGKSAGMKRAVEELETIQSFPAVGLREVATWIMDEPAASLLDKKYST